MDSRSPSQTAIGVATLRVVHRWLDGDPKIVDDPVTERLLGAGARERILDNPAEFLTAVSSGLRAHVLARSRFAEERLAEAVGRGVRDYLLIGAGLDTFAYRQPEWARDLRILELDHPATQLWKRQRLEEGGIPIPANVRYLSADLESDDVAGVLLGAEVDPSRPLFMSCLGVLIYLRPETTRAVLEFAGSRAEGSELVLTYSTRDHNEHLAARAAAAGEPWLSEFDPDEWRGLLRDAGFATVGLIEADWVAKRYFRGRNDGLSAPRRGSLAFGMK